MHGGPLGSSVHGNLQARLLEWVAVPPSQGDLPNPGIEPRYPALQEDSLLSEPPGKPREGQGIWNRNTKHSSFWSGYVYTWKEASLRKVKLLRGYVGLHLSSCIASSSSCHCTSFTYTSLIHMLDYIEREGGVEGSVSFPTSILCLRRKLQKGSSISLFKTSNDKGFPNGSDSKGSACIAGDLDSVSGLGRSLEKGMTTHSSILAWRTPWTEEPGRLKFMGSQRVRHDWATNIWGFPGGTSKEPACQRRTCKRRRFDPWVGNILWRRKRQPTPVSLPGESHGQIQTIQTRGLGKVCKVSCCGH